MCCVDPPEYTDGLLENIPAIINKTDYFSLSVMGLDYTNAEEWDLDLSTNIESVMLTTIVVKNLNISASDSTSLYLLNDEGDTIFIAGVLSNFNFSNQDSIKNIGFPKKVILNANNFTGNLDCQLIIN
tara:strand:- start:800 stop:1183 length:384 start_codon:yes stop_codon:yes gene_type:complete